jgi:hypothetical protein
VSTHLRRPDSGSANARVRVDRLASLPGLVQSNLEYEPIGVPSSAQDSHEAITHVMPTGPVPYLSAGFRPRQLGRHPVPLTTQGHHRQARTPRSECIGVLVQTGGLGTIPWRAREAEDVLTGAPASDQAFRAAAAAALRDPFAVDGNAFKVELAERTIVRVLQDLAGAQP